jgi:hypothetical protein
MAADLSVDSTTITRYETRDISGVQKETLLPATQFLGVDVDKLADGNLSLHLYGWGRADLADKSFNSDRASGRLTYGYLQYRLKETNADIRAGRFFVHEGIVNEQVDGVSARSDLPYGFGISAFGGANVHTKKRANENSDGKGEALYGGRVNYRYKGMLELGASGVYETRAPALQNYPSKDRRLAGGDVWFSPFRMVEVMGHTSFNTTTKEIAEHSYLLNVKPLQNLVLTGEFNDQRERYFRNSWTIFAPSSPATAPNHSEKSRSVGGMASYSILKNFDISADYKHYTREIGNADRYGANAKFAFLGNSLRNGIGYHYLRAGQGFDISGYQGSASFHELRGYSMLDTKTVFAAVDLIGYFFKEKIYNEKSAWEATASLGYHFTPALAVSGDISHGRNPQFTEETKGLLRLTYNMTYIGKGVNK